MIRTDDQERQLVSPIARIFREIQELLVRPKEPKCLQICPFLDIAIQNGGLAVPIYEGYGDDLYQMEDIYFAELGTVGCSILVSNRNIDELLSSCG